MDQELSSDSPTHC